MYFSGSQLETNKKAMTIQVDMGNSIMERLYWVPDCILAPSTLKIEQIMLLTFNSFKMQCKVCMQTFICTTSEVKCREHAEAKHPKSDVYACFPHLKK
ncbi:hypothetical protein Goklo_027690 [Gossypium klotzschianum]|uniref:At2g23090-like zinc-binding domain-containing protein n=1 Tax=Gossypium klotzschianum TaxID=34286 RepID=A0A7J8TZ12_9ROSI|nr:hypothetical protein [Gossypium klotzschianum]